jgi:protein-disulfide isomerase
VVAPDPATGRERWTYDPRVDLGRDYGDFANRCVSAWRDSVAGNGTPGALRIYVATVDARLIALDAERGMRCERFGRGGTVDLARGVPNPPAYPGEYEVTSPPAVIGGLLVVGSSIGDNNRADAPSGVVRAYDARTGAATTTARLLQLSRGAGVVLTLGSGADHPAEGISARSCGDARGRTARIVAIVPHHWPSPGRFTSFSAPSLCHARTSSVPGARRIRYPCFPALMMAGVVAGCSPSPARLRDEVVKHPDIVIAAIEAHPEAFIAALQQAAGKANAAAQSPTAVKARLDEAFAHRQYPVITRRAVLGNPSAPVTIVEYSDFQCPYCRAERDVLVQLLREYGDSLRLVVKHTPLDTHRLALPAALMYEAVARQSPMAAYRFYDELFANQARLDAQGEQYLAVAAKVAGADSARARADAQGPEVRAVVEADLEEGRRFGFTGTPGFLINGVALMGAHPIGDFEQIINRHLAMAGNR